ncbi:threonine synthase [Pseudobacteriovorax antillogorgiicola]|uniref:Threonine synthase n=1 Tax=Pseudobacteriovorax antillogorgiicola TaxID=1513793 RepID=A0A1Y6CKY0_9BACT|nr:threonine synthase [Pseudobacteriovorax antillogorgiicola]TCS46150.1 threonine synthase [Pseudobacteriovorax antillogorgiicola]SMF69787.1 threonine synthase [Pseudobacteriovorax antillogorgiicola]
MNEVLRCIECQQEYSIDRIRYSCDCGGLLAVERPLEKLKELQTSLFDQRCLSQKDVDVSGVWRFREGILSIPESEIVTHPEGNTRLYRRKALAHWSGIDDIAFKHEGENPTGSFKDRGMTLAVTQAKRLGANVVACASTGNTSAALAAYAAQAGLKSVVFLPDGKVAMGKLAQALGYGAQCLAITGSFDVAMAMVKDLAERGDVYLVNSLNPFRLEGQKSIIWEILQNLSWQAPDWIVVPGGNLGNTSAFGKALREAYDAGWISKLPRIASIQAEGANPFYKSYQQGLRSLDAMEPETVATAIRIGNPVNFHKAKRVIKDLNGVVEQVTDQEIIAAKLVIDRQGIGCEPASACSLAGAKKLRDQGIIKAHESVVGILTGHMLKDTDAVLQHSGRELEPIRANLEEISKKILN